MPSQQPPDWWNISGPWISVSFDQQLGRRRGQRDPLGAGAGTSVTAGSGVPLGRLTRLHQKKPSAFGE